jgi:hypothetical protein
MLGGIGKACETYSSFVQKKQLEKNKIHFSSHLVPK